MKTKKNKIKYNKNNKKTQTGGSNNKSTIEIIKKSLPDTSTEIQNKIVEFIDLNIYNYKSFSEFNDKSSKIKLFKLSKDADLISFLNNETNYNKLIEIILKKSNNNLNDKSPLNILIKIIKFKNEYELTSKNKTDNASDNNAEFVKKNKVELIELINNNDLINFIKNKENLNIISDVYPEYNLKQHIGKIQIAGTVLPVKKILEKLLTSIEKGSMANVSRPGLKTNRTIHTTTKNNSSINVNKTRKNTSSINVNNKIKDINKTKVPQSKILSDFSGSCNLFSLSKKKNAMRGKAFIFSKSSLLTRFKSLDLVDSQHSDFNEFLQKFTVDFCINHEGDRKYIALCFNIIDCVKNPDSFIELAKNIYTINLTKKDESILITELKLEKSSNSKKAINDHIIKTNSTHLAKFIVQIFKKAFNAYDKKNINQFPNGRSNKLKVRIGLKKLLLKINIDSNTIQKIFIPETPEKESEKIIIAKLSDPSWKQQLGKNSDKEIDAAIKKEEQHEEKLKQASLSGNFDDENRTPAYLFYVGIMGLLAFMANSDMFNAPPTFTRV